MDQHISARMTAPLASPRDQVGAVSSIARTGQSNAHICGKLASDIAFTPSQPYRRASTDRDVAQSGSALYWGCRGRWFESSRPDQWKISGSERNSGGNYRDRRPWALKISRCLRISRPSVNVPGARACLGPRGDRWGDCAPGTLPQSGQFTIDQHAGLCRSEQHDKRSQGTAYHCQINSKVDHNVLLTTRIAQFYYPTFAGSGVKLGHTT